MAPERTCISCKHWLFYAGDRGYGEYTPATQWSSWCALSVWHVSGWSATQEDFRAALLTATNCDKFEQRA